MELKKSPKADLENKRKYFLQIGAIIALAAVIGMFSWSQKERVIERVEQEAVAVQTEEMTEVTVQEDKRPPAPLKTQAVAISEMLNIVKNDAKIEQTINLLDLDVTELAVDVTKFGGNYKGESELQEDEPVIIAETMPTFNGGDQNKFAQWCGKNVRYPQAAIDNGSQGKVTVQFVVERDGSISRITILRGVDKLIDDEAIRVVKSAPKWSPGMNRGKPVRVYIQVPINFVLE